MSFPTFFLCLLLIKWFAVDLHWLPVGGMTNTGSDDSGWGYILQVAAHLVLPVLALVMLRAGSLTRYFRASMLEVVRMDFIRTARAKGLRERTVILKHAFAERPAAHYHAARLRVAGAVFRGDHHRKVFNWPGAGHIHIDSLAARDYPVLMGFTLFLAVLTILAICLPMCFTRGSTRIRAGGPDAQFPLSSNRRLRDAEIPALAQVTPVPGVRRRRCKRHNRLAMLCACCCWLSWPSWCTLGPLWSPWKDDATDALMINKPPGAQHWLVPIFLGRDIYTRLLTGRTHFADYRPADHAAVGHPWLSARRAVGLRRRPDR